MLRGPGKQLALHDKPHMATVHGMHASPFLTTCKRFATAAMYASRAALLRHAGIW